MLKFQSVPSTKCAGLGSLAGAPHGLCTTHADVINKELLEFLQE